MIKQLRIKFIAITMSLLCIVLLLVFGTIAISSYHQSANESLQIMEHQLSLDDKGAIIKPQIGSPSGMFMNDMVKKDDNQPMRMLPMVNVTVDQNMNIIFTLQDNATISDEDLKLAISYAMENPDISGIISELNLRYMKKSIENNMTQIVFADRTSEIASFKTLLFTLVLIFVSTTIVFFIICILLSRWALKPVEKAWIKQKQFIADASHELKTPLTIILANLGIMNGHKEQTIASQMQWLDNTVTEAQRMKKLVEDLLFLAKSDASEMPISKDTFNFSDDLWSVILPFETYAFEQGLEITENIQENIFYYGDSAQLRQLMAILLDNSCKYARKGTCITVNLSTVTDKIILSVHNIGSFIPAEDIEHIFDRFYRADKSRSNSQGSYGLGLAIAKSITDNHHGKIYVHSDESAGTTFYVHLPLSL